MMYNSFRAVDNGHPHTHTFSHTPPYLPRPLTHGYQTVQGLCTGASDTPATAPRTAGRRASPPPRPPLRPPRLPTMSASKKIKVCVRFRPSASFAQDNIRIAKNGVTIQARKDEGGHGDSSGVCNNAQDSWNFKFHAVLQNASQETVFDTIAREVVMSAVDGVNGTIFAYGQTGAGKTFSMIGDTSMYQQRGVVPRAVAELFSEVNNRVEYDFKVSVTYMEIYNERIFDLLSGPIEDQRHDFPIIEDKTGLRGTYVKGLHQEEIRSEEEALHYLFKGNEVRTTARHQLNERSNRSHCIYTLHIEQRSKLGAAEKVLLSKLHLVDLAGSERLKKAIEPAPGTSRAADAAIKRESMYINKSLTYLEQCVVALTTKSREHVPYRQTKLTSVLRDSIGGNCHTLMLACVWGEAKHLEETISTLKLASRMMRVENTAGFNIEMDPVMQVKKMEREIKALKQELLMHDALSERSGVTYDEYTPEQRDEVKQDVASYMAAPLASREEEEIFQGKVQSLRHMNEVFRQFKMTVKQMEAETETRLRAQFTLTAKGEGGGAGGDGAVGFADGVGGDGAGGGEEGGEAGGDLLSSTGFGVGLAPSDARPTTVDTGSPTRMGGSGNWGDESMQSRAGSESPTSAMSPNRSISTRMAGMGMNTGGASKARSGKGHAFDVYKASLGRGRNERLVRNKAELKSVRSRHRSNAKRANQLMAQMGTLKADLEIKEATRRAEQGAAAPGAMPMVDEEEFRMLQELKRHKLDYRVLHESVQGDSRTMQKRKGEVDEGRASLVHEFEEWLGTDDGMAALAGQGAGPMRPDVDEDADFDASLTGGFGASMTGMSMPGGGGGDMMDEGEMFDEMELQVRERRAWWGWG